MHHPVCTIVMMRPLSPELCMLAVHTVWTVTYLDDCFCAASGNTHEYMLVGPHNYMIQKSCVKNLDSALLDVTQIQGQ